MKIRFHTQNDAINKQKNNSRINPVMLDWTCRYYYEFIFVSSPRALMHIKQHIQTCMSTS